MSEATVSAGYAKALVALAVKKGAAPTGFAEIAGINLLASEEPDSRVPFSIFQRLMRHAIDALDDPGFGLRFGAESEFVDMSIVGLIAHASETMGEAFVQVNRFARLAIEVEGHDEGDRFAITRRDGEVWLEDRRRDPNDFPELTESSFARFITNTARHMGPVPFGKFLLVTHRRPAHFAEYTAILNVPVTFDADRNALAIDESWLSLKLTSPNRYVFGIFSDRAQSLLDDLLQRKTCTGQVEAAILKILHTGDISMTRIAQKLGQSQATLYRRLKAENITFNTLVDRLRHQMAVNYLDGQKLSVGEVAYLLGFSDPSSFSRAHKRWTGASPRAAKN